MSERSKNLARELRSKAEEICSLKRKQRKINKVYIIMFTICLTSMLIGRSLVESMHTKQQADETPTKDIESDYNDNDHDLFVFF